MQGRLVGLKSAPLPSLISNDSVPACVKVGHALICNPRSSSPVSFQSRNLDYFPSAPATPQSILYAEKHPNSLTATQLLLPCLLPSPVFIPLLQSATSLEPFPKVHQHALVPSPSTPSPASVRVELNEIEFAGFKVQIDGGTKPVFKITSESVKKQLEV